MKPRDSVSQSAAGPASERPAALQAQDFLWRARLDGPQNLFTGRVFWLVTVAVVVFLLAYPTFGSVFMTSNLTNFLLNLPLALGLALLWGYCGVLSFGQMAFFTIAGYAYGIAAMNFGDGTLTVAAAVLALLATAAIGVIFGYFMFYGRVSGWIVPVLTLVFTLVLETFLGQTAGYQWRIGNALLGGYNGMTGIPSLSIGDLKFNGFTAPLFYITVVLIALLYVGLRILGNGHFGRVLVAMREDLERTELLGYDIRLYQLATFVLAAVLAGLSGVLYVSWGNYITPSSAGLLAATMPVLWVAVGGKTSFTAVLISTVLLGLISDALAVYSGEFAFVLLGALLLFGMMFAPGGIIVTLAAYVRQRLAGGERP